MKVLSHPSTGRLEVFSLQASEYVVSNASGSITYCNVLSGAYKRMDNIFYYTVRWYIIAHYPITFMLCDIRDADETKEWIEEKNQALNTDNYGHDLASVQALQRKHEGFERDLAALGDKVRISW